ncbi:ankyrin repeat domain-containing protein [Roseovarius sp. A-2]|uniref:ankyrin repeat domain-containing protein n=1 Tax=Roseovarius sp. A-2 TaxID=1570360 RepID=UPI0009B52C4E|nr:ankyrin repeat domain-containing protein [Roseovarius sp. A-2]
MSKKFKSRETLDQLLSSCSDTMFPAEMGEAPVSIDSRDSVGDTPLHVMLWRKNTYGALLLIEAGADLNAVGDMSETPLHVAVSQGNIKVVEALLKSGANPAAKSEFGKSPKEIAVELGGEMQRCFGSQ